MQFTLPSDFVVVSTNSTKYGCQQYVDKKPLARARIREHSF